MNGELLDEVVTTRTKSRWTCVASVTVQAFLGWYGGRPEFLIDAWRLVHVFPGSTSIVRYMARGLDALGASGQDGDGEMIYEQHRRQRRNAICIVLS